MHCDMIKIQDGVAIVEKLNWHVLIDVHDIKSYRSRSDLYVGTCS